MLRICIASIICAGLDACASTATEPIASDGLNCRESEPTTGSNIVRRSQCTVMTDEERERAKTDVEAMRAEQMRRSMPRPGGSQ